MELSDMQSPSVGGDFGYRVANVYYYFERYSGTATISARSRGYLQPGQCSWSSAKIDKSIKFLSSNVQITPQVSMLVEFTPTTNTDGTQGMSNMSINFNTHPEGMPEFLSFLPAVGGGPGTSSDTVRGSILDSNMVFEFVVDVPEGRNFVTLNQQLRSYLWSP